jgi:hypothetical protein
MLDALPGAIAPAYPDPLGPVSFTEAEAHRTSNALRDPHPSNSRPVSWNLTARTPAAKALCAALARQIEEATGPGRQREKLVAGVEALIGSLMLAAYAGEWAAQATGNEALAEVPIGAFRFNKVRKVLSSAGFIDVKPGYFDQGFGIGLSTKFRATPALLRFADTWGVHSQDAWRHFGRDKERSPDVPRDKAVLLRSLDRTSLILPDTIEASRLVDEIVAFNAFVRTFSVTYGPDDDARDIGPQFQRIFTENLRLHGRVYVVGGGYQRLPSVPRRHGQGNLLGDYSRRTLKIDGEPCVELDVRASHLTIIHGLVGVPLPQGGDPYAVIQGIPREVVKAWVASRIGQGKAPSSWNRETVEDFRADHGIDLTRFRVGDVATAIRDAMPFLGRGLPALLGVADQPRLCSHVLMGIEARALTRAMMALKERGILGLPLHDALIVQERHAEAAREALEAGYHAEAGIVPVVRVKRGVEAA